MKKLLSALLLLTLAFGGCKKSGDSAADGKFSGEPIKVGEFASLTGAEATFGQSSHEGTLLAVEEANAAGG
ncbi:MAG: ethanolamine utilization protein EutJ, partial [Verrucomicrobiota bacterium]